jgi:hypothetical protein
MGALLRFPTPLVDRQRARVAERERQLAKLRQRQADELAIAEARVEAERKALLVLEGR